MSQDVLSIELQISEENAKVVLSRSKQKLEDFVKTAEKAQPNIKFKIDNQGVIDLEKLEKRAEQTRQTFAAISATRLDSGSLGHLSKEIVQAHERARQLHSDISNVKKELADPNRKSSIAFLTDELRAAEREAEKLDRKLNSLSGGAANGRGAANNLKLSGFQKTNLSYQINDVLTGFASGQNPTQILAQQGGQIAQIFDPAQIAAFSAAYSGLVTILGAGAVAIAATYKITGDLRAEAERRLKVEEMITGAINRQRIAQREAYRDLQKDIADADRRRSFSQFLQTDDLEALKKRRDLIEQLIKPNAQNVSLVPAALPAIENGKVVQKPNEAFETLRRERLELNERINQVPLERNAQALKSFEQRNEDFKKAQAAAIDYEKRRAEQIANAEKKRLEDVEKAKEKVKQLEKIYLDTFSNLNVKLNSNNPFVAVFSDADKALKDLRENIKGLPPELQKIAVQMQSKINFRQFLTANLDNQLSAFDLRSDADNFRSPFNGEKQKKDQQEFVERFLRNNPNYLFSENKSSLDDETRSRILKQFAPSSLNETPADRLNKTLDDKFNLLYKPGQTEQQLAVADRKFISLTEGANPLDLSKNLRESAALVREREAVRQERYQQEAMTLYREQRDYQRQIAENTKNQNKIAEKGGSKAIEITLKDRTSSGGAAQLQSSATASDVGSAYYDPNLDFSGNGFTNR